MTWILIALIPPFLYSISNFLDEFLIEKYTKQDGIGSLILFSGLFGIIVAPIIAFFVPDVFSISINNILILVSVGILNVLYVLLYLYAMESDEATVVAPLYQLIPVFGFFLGWSILGEVLDLRQIIGSAIIVFGGLIIALDLELSQGLGFKVKPFLLMAGASFIAALTEILFKVAAIPDTFWVSSFWNYIGFIIISVILFFAVKSYRRSFINMLKNNTNKVLGLNFGNEIITGAGDLILRLVLLFIPVFLVQTVVSTQPIFILLIGIILTIFFPKISKQKIYGKHLVHKIIAILIIVLGGILIV